MRTLTRVAVAGFIAIAGTQPGALHAQRSLAQPRAVPGEVIVKYKTTAGPTERGRARGRVAAAAVTELARSPRARAHGPIELVRIPGSSSIESALATLRSDPAVEYAEPNWIYTHAAIPNDSSFSQQWALDNTGQSVGGRRGTVDADIDAPQAWDTVSSAPTVYIGVIDQGIDYKHPDLGVQPGGVIWTNPFDPVDGIDNDGNGYIDDVHGWDFDADDNTVYDGTASDIGTDSHGTHVAGTIGARTGNGIGIAGVSPGVVIIPAKFLGESGGTTANAILALDYLTDLKVRHGLNVIATNNSWNGGGFSQGLLDAIGRAAREDILFIAAAGNGGPDEVADNNDVIQNYPSNYNTAGIAGYDAVVAVTATGQSDELASWANYGFTTVDLGAPGAQILSTTPQNTYTYSSGTSMAVPHVTGAVALIHAARGLVGQQLRDALLAGVDPIASHAGKTVTAGRLNLARSVDPYGSGGGGSPGMNPEIVLYAGDTQAISGNWTVIVDASAAGGSRIQSVNLGASKIVTALSNPADYFELSFQADAGTAYRLWLRGRAENNSWANDSVHVQFDGSVDADGSPTYRIGTTASAAINFEDCSGCGLSGWGWQDNGYGAGVLGPVIYFASTGRQRLRIQTREDGVGIDQIVLSSVRYLTASPGRLKGDTMIVPPVVAVPASVDEVVLYATTATIAGDWTRTADATAAAGLRLQNGNDGMPKIVTAVADPVDYFELPFRAEANKKYRLWIRGKALANSWANDSVHVQFSDSVTAAGIALYRIGTTSSAEVNLEDCSGCGLAGWGWQDNGYGPGVLGPEIRFATTGSHTVRIQVREDGFAIDQIVLSSVKYVNQAPGSLKNDSTILAKQ